MPVTAPLSTATKAPDAPQATARADAAPASLDEQKHAFLRLVTH